MKHARCRTVVAPIAAFAATSMSAETPTPGFNDTIPEKLLTPDTVQTRIGTLDFLRGVGERTAG